MPWTPAPFNLLNGNPFQYSDHSISAISATEAFETGIDSRDEGKCLVCNLSVALQHCHIIPNVERDTWQQMKVKGFVPAAAKSVAHEPRNGILLCATHHVLFDKHYYYIRWMPDESRFVFINHSRAQDLEVFHGKAINLHVGDNRLPFHGAFLLHEMRVRGRWALNGDRGITLPIPWINNPDGDSDEISDDDGGDRGNGGGQGLGNSGPSVEKGGHHLRSRGAVSDSSASGKVFIPTNPFDNPTTLQALKDSFAEQPNWKAAIKEGTAWEGNADENAAKWRRLNNI